MSEVNEILFLFHLLVLDLPRERLIVSVYTEGSIRVDRGVRTRTQMTFSSDAEPLQRERSLFIYLALVDFPRRNAQTEIP